MKKIRPYNYILEGLITTSLFLFQDAFEKAYVIVNTLNNEEYRFNELQLIKVISESLIYINADNTELIYDVALNTFTPASEFSLNPYIKTKKENQ